MLNWNLCRGVPVIPKSEKVVNMKANLETSLLKMSDDDVHLITKTCDKHEILLSGTHLNGYSLFA